ncbi:MAG: FHA domain-containing protein [Ardenticatenaceae bacterium]
MTLLLFGLRIVLLLLLYAFLFMLAWLVWRDLKQASTVAPDTQRTPRGGRLTVIESGDSGYAEGQHFPLQTITTIGRDLSNDIVVADAYASTRHAHIERHSDGRFWLIDVGSRNGTVLNGQPLRANDPVPLDLGDVIAIGKARFKMG